MRKLTTALAALSLLAFAACATTKPVAEPVEEQAPVQQQDALTAPATDAAAEQAPVAPAATTEEAPAATAGATN